MINSKYRLLIFAFFFIHNVFSQNHQIDSLKNLLVSATDTEKVDIYLGLAKQMIYIDRKLAIEYAKISLKYAKKKWFKRIGD